MILIKNLLERNLELSEGTLKEYTNAVNRALNIPAQVNKKDLKSLLKSPAKNTARFKEHVKDLAPTTHNITLSAIMALEKACLKEGLVSHELLTNYDKRRVPKRLPKPVPEEEVPEILANIKDAQDKLIFELLLGSGLRNAEACSLTFGDISYDGIVTVVGKGNKERQTFLTTQTLEALQDWVWVGHLKSEEEGTRQDKVKALVNMPQDKGIFLTVNDTEVKDLGSPTRWLLDRVRTYTKYTPHQFRHFWFTDLLNNGADIGAVMDAGGHESLRTTKGYKKILKRQTTGLRSMHSREKGRL